MNRYLPWWVAVCGLVLGTAAGANDTALLVRGGLASAMREHPSIRMVAAEIHADIFNGYSLVRCDYLFRNEGEATTVTMGFPSLPGYGDIQEQAVAPPLADFRTWVDGAEVSTRQVREAGSVKQPGRRWYVKEVAFAAGQERQVRDTYRQPNGRVSDGTQFFPYVLSTGASWHGPIGAVRVGVLWGEDWEWTPYPRPWEQGEWEQQPNFDDFRWSADELEPDFDLRFDFAPGWQQLYVDGYRTYDWGTVDVRVLPTEVYITARTLARVLGAVLTYAARRHAAQFEMRGGRWYEAQAGSRVAALDGEPVRGHAESAPYEEAGTMWVPVGDLLHALGWEKVAHYPECVLRIRTGAPEAWEAEVQGLARDLAPEAIYLARQDGVLLGEIRPLLTAIGEVSGGETRLDDAGPEADFRLLRGLHDFRFSWGQTRAWREEQPYELPVAPYINAVNRGMAPVEAFLAGFGLRAEYDEEKKLLTVSE